MKKAGKVKGVGSVAPSVFGALVGSASWGGVQPLGEAASPCHDLARDDSALV